MPQWLQTAVDPMPVGEHGHRLGDFERDQRILRVQSDPQPMLGTAVTAQPAIPEVNAQKVGIGGFVHRVGFSRPGRTSLTYDLPAARVA